MGFLHSHVQPCTLTSYSYTHLLHGCQQNCSALSPHMHHTFPVHSTVHTAQAHPTACPPYLPLALEPAWPRRSLQVCAVRGLCGCTVDFLPPLVSCQAHVFGDRLINIDVGSRLRTLGVHLPGEHNGANATAQWFPPMEGQPQPPKPLICGPWACFISQQFHIGGSERSDRG